MKASAVISEAGGRGCAEPLANEGALQEPQEYSDAGRKKMAAAVPTCGSTSTTQAN